MDEEKTFTSGSGTHRSIIESKKLQQPKEPLVLIGCFFFSHAMQNTDSGVPLAWDANRNRTQAAQAQVTLENFCHGLNYERSVKGMTARPQ